MDILFKILIYAPPFIIAVVLHEVAHGYIAYKLGDPTAKIKGRITLNPISHIDPVLTIAIPAMLILFGSPIIFGGAKPVPVYPNNFNNPRKDMAIVAIAGPITNFIIATFSYILFYLILFYEQIIPLPSFALLLIINWLAISIIVNIILGVFNLFPVPPLDGGRILVGILPINLARKVNSLERYGFMIVILCLFLGVFDTILNPFLKFTEIILLQSGAV